MFEFTLSASVSLLSVILASRCFVWLCRAQFKRYTISGMVVAALLPLLVSPSSLRFCRLTQTQIKAFKILSRIFRLLLLLFSLYPLSLLVATVALTAAAASVAVFA